MRSSYIENNYGPLFTALASIQRPKSIVECGVLDGYSLIALADGAPKDCSIVGYDLFEDYEFKNSIEQDVRFHMWQSGITREVSLVKQDAFEAAKNHKDQSVDILHIDISNDGDNLPLMFDAWAKKITPGGIVIFEGGSIERDKVEWMVKYKKTPIKYFKSELRDLGFEYVTLLPHPSLTICRKTILPTL